MSALCLSHPLSRRLRASAGGGGCFPMHCDSDEEVDGRRVSAICYLNPEWRTGDGGEVRTYLQKVDLLGYGRLVIESHSFTHVSERAMPWCMCKHTNDVRGGAQLRLYPFPHAPVDIAPLCDRMVLFPSTTMLHRRAPPHHAGAAAPHFHLIGLQVLTYGSGVGRVLPSGRDRFCFTLWLSQSRGRPPPPPSLPSLLRQIPTPGTPARPLNIPWNSCQRVTMLGDSSALRVFRQVHDVAWRQAEENVGCMNRKPDSVRAQKHNVILIIQVLHCMPLDLPASIGTFLGLLEVMTAGALQHKLFVSIQLFLLRLLGPVASREAVAVLLQQPEARKYAAKWFYAAPWAASIEESHPPSAARDAALEQHWREACALERAFAGVCGLHSESLRAYLRDLALADIPPGWL